MNTTIRKYQLSNIITVPKNAVILKVGWQEELLSAAFIWMLINPNETVMEERTFQILITGSVVKDNNLLIKPTYIDTIFCFKDKLFVYIYLKI